MIRKLLSLGLTACAMGQQPVSAHQAPASFIAPGPTVEAPRGYSEMCSTLKALCASFQRANASPAVLSDPSPQTYAILGPTQALRHGLNSTELPYPTSMHASGHEISAIAGAVATGSLFETTSSNPIMGQDSSDIYAANLVFSGFNPIHSSAWARPLAMSYVLSHPVDGFTDDGQPVASPAPVPLGEPKRLLDQINRHVNSRVHQQLDSQTYGVAELWRPSGDDRHAKGDCEDLAIEKRVELLAAHFPAERLFFAVVYGRQIGLHTVLVARLDQGDVVLDSRTSVIQPWAGTPYTWLAVEAPGNPGTWRKLQPSYGGV